MRSTAVGPFICDWYCNLTWYNCLLAHAGVEPMFGESTDVLKTCIITLETVS